MIIEDVNDNSPTFSKSVYDVSISESVQVGELVSDISSMLSQNALYVICLPHFTRVHHYANENPVNNLLMMCQLRLPNNTVYFLFK